MTLNEWISFGVKNHLIEDSDAIASAITLAQLKKTADIDRLYRKSDRRDSNPRFKGEE